MAKDNFPFDDNGDSDSDSDWDDNSRSEYDNSKAVTMVAAGTLRLNNSLQQFFETNSMLDEIGEGNFNVSGSTSDEKFIF